MGQIADFPVIILGNFNNSRFSQKLLVNVVTLGRFDYSPCPLAFALVITLIFITLGDS